MFKFVNLTEVFVSPGVARDTINSSLGYSSYIVIKSTIRNWASVLGDKKVTIYVPLTFHKEVLKNFKGKQVKVTLEDAL